MNTVTYKGFVISYRHKPWMISSGFDYDWHYLYNDDTKVFWKYAPNLQSAMDDIDQHLLNQSFCNFNTLESEGDDFENLNWNVIIYCVEIGGVESGSGRCVVNREPWNSELIATTRLSFFCNQVHYWTLVHRGILYTNRVGGMRPYSLSPSGRMGEHMYS